ncbi:MAG: hypothetical protein ACE5NC_08960 [Anaerolineae bacterium]
MRFLFLVVLALLLSACGSRAQIRGIETATAGPETVPAADTATLTATRTPTRTPRPTRTATPTRTPTATPTGFYTQFRTVRGFTVKASSAVATQALDEAARVFRMLVSGNPQVVARLRSFRAEVAVIGRFEDMTDLPDYAFLRGREEPFEHWFDGAGARGMGGSLRVPVCSAGEENLLGLPGDVYAGQSILIHRCAHSVYNLGLNPSQRAAWEATYRAAMAAGRWQDTYAARNAYEFFAELTQSYFGVNQSPQAGVHIEINTAADLAEYEPDGHRFLIQVYRRP